MRAIRVFGVAALLAPAPVLPVDPMQAPKGSDLDGGWKAIMEPYLQQDLWTESQAYDASHGLLLPIHAAFDLGKTAWQADLAAHYRRFVAGAGELPKNPLSRAQYLYVASCFAAEAASHHRQDLIPPGLMETLCKEFQLSWSPSPGNGEEATILRKLGTTPTPKRFQKALEDKEFFAVGTAANLQAVMRALGVKVPAQTSGSVAEALSLAHRMFKEQVVWGRDGGWLMQPGAWSDYADFLYAGQMEKRPGMPLRPISDIAWDSSHFMRFPAILCSLRDANSPASPEYAFYDRLVRGLEIQIFSHVAEPPSPQFPAWRFRNFMDGRNGVYRWGYQTMGANHGFGPFEVPPLAFTYGWWSLLGSGRIRSLYKNIQEQSQVNSEVSILYSLPLGGLKIEGKPVKTPKITNRQIRALDMQLASNG